jgi:hypothetical protein
MMYITLTPKNTMERKINVTNAFSLKFNLMTDFYWENYKNKQHIVTNYYHDILTLLYWSILRRGLLWPWSYGSWIYNYLCNQCRSPLKLWVWIPLRRVVLDTTLCDKSLLVTCDRSEVLSTNKTDHHDITEILLKAALNTITLTLYFKNNYLISSKLRSITRQNRK